MMDEKMTTEQFHQLLLENTTRHADERKRHQNELARLRTEYNIAIDEIASMEDEALDEYRSSRLAWEEAQACFNQKKRKLAKRRDLAGQALNYGKAQEANLWTLNNNIIQSNRHNIFERYRLSGGHCQEIQASYFTQDGPNERKE